MQILISYSNKSGWTLRSCRFQTINCYCANLRLLVLSFLIGISLGACSGSDQINGVSEQSGAQMRLSSPFNTGSDRALDIESLSPVVIIDDADVSPTFDSVANTWLANFDVPSDQQVRLLVEWYYEDMLIALYDQMIGPAEGLSSLLIRSNDYLTEGPQFDPDQDGISNLQEANNNTNPNDARNIDVVIPELPPNTVPGINGITGVVWEQIEMFNWRGEALLIDNLMIDQGADRADQSAEFHWKAAHNREKLFIIVYGENVNNETPQADSSSARDDDTLNVFFDGNNSKGDFYDNLDDYHLRIPLYPILQPVNAPENSVVVLDNNNHLTRDTEGQILVESNGETFYLTAGDLMSNVINQPDSRVEAGDNSVSLPASLDYATGRSLDAQHVFEMSVLLTDISVQLNREFGLEFQMDDDIDGLARDARYGWKHPSRAMTDVDGTASSPSFMGTAMLQLN